MWSFVVWCLVAISAVYWASQFLARPAPVPAQATTVGPAPTRTVSLTRLFGEPVVAAVVAAPAAPLVDDSRFKLIGLAAPRAGQRSGLALIAVGDKPARALPLGAEVDEGLVVLAISHRQVDLGPRGGASTLSLTLPAMPEPSRGVPMGQMPGGAMGGATGAQAAVPPALAPGQVPMSVPPLMRPAGMQRSPMMGLPPPGQPGVQGFPPQPMAAPPGGPAGEAPQGLQQR